MQLNGWHGAEEAKTKQEPAPPCASLLTWMRCEAARLSPLHNVYSHTNDLTPDKCSGNEESVQTADGGEMRQEERWLQTHK